MLTKPTDRDQAALAQVEKLARLMDGFFLDPLLGLGLPGAGDVIGAAAGLYAVAVAWRLKASKVLIARMMLNLSVDLLGGAIPGGGGHLGLLLPRAHAQRGPAARAPGRGAGTIQPVGLAGGGRGGAAVPDRARRSDSPGGAGDPPHARVGAAAARKRIAAPGAPLSRKIGVRQTAARCVMRQCAPFLSVAVLLAISAPAEAKHFRYHSRHPYKGGFCYIEVAHSHGYAPNDGRVYRMVDGEYYFVGDPVAYGYEGPRYAYYGEHPVVEVGIHFGEPEYCYLQGPHYHWYSPPPETRFESRSGVYWYVGAFEPVYWRARPRYVVINDVYRPMRYERPVVALTAAPPTWRGLLRRSRRGGGLLLRRSRCARGPWLASRRGRRCRSGSTCRWAIPWRGRACRWAIPWRGRSTWSEAVRPATSSTSTTTTIAGATATAAAMTAATQRQRQRPWPRPPQGQVA
jgi:hypothetical protein